MKKVIFIVIIAFAIFSVSCDDNSCQEENESLKKENALLQEELNLFRERTSLFSKSNTGLDHLHGLEPKGIGPLGDDYQVLGKITK